MFSPYSLKCWRWFPVAMVENYSYSRIGQLDFSVMFQSRAKVVLTSDKSVRNHRAAGAGLPSERHERTRLVGAENSRFPQRALWHHMSASPWCKQTQAVRNPSGLCASSPGTPMTLIKDRG